MKSLFVMSCVLIVLCAAAVGVMLLGIVIIDALFTKYQKQSKKKLDEARQQLQVTCCRIYKPGTRKIAKVLKEGNNGPAIVYAANCFIDWLPKNAVIIPVPSHNGRATYMREVADKIVEKRKDITVADICRGRERKPWCEMKKKGTDKHILSVFNYFGFKIKSRKLLRKENPIIWIDNVIHTGTTLAVATSLIQGSEAMVFADAREAGWLK